MRLKKVLILSASAGAGHLRAAQAVERAFLELNVADEVRNIDTLEYTNPLFRRLYTKSYIEMVNRMPELFGFFYEYFDKPWQKERRRLAFDKLNTRPFVKMLEDYQPDIAVCTHFLPAGIISWLKEKKRIDTRQAVVVTDFDLHAFWLCRHYDHYFVAMEETKAHLQEIGLAPETITVSGIPIDPVFAKTLDKLDMRRRYNLEPDWPVILVSAGGFGVGPVEKLVRSLTKMRNKARVIVICGRNAELKDNVDKVVSTMPPEANVRFTTVGFTDQMEAYMAASDLLLGKTGGLTTSEALAKGLGFVIVDPIPGQEQRNADHLLEEGVAVKCNNWPILAYKIDKLLDNPAQMAAMQQKARRLAKPAAAYDIVKKLTSL
jgi:processive 1,2-diacylglycerol beta-glucosyltransferase